MSRGQAEDESGSRMLGIVAQDIEPDVSQQGNDGRPVVAMNQAGILAQVDILGAVPSILNEPVPSACNGSYYIGQKQPQS